MMRQFSGYALEKLLDLYSNHSHEVGSQLFQTDPEKYKSFAYQVVNYSTVDIGTTEVRG
jgi:hypothetical protein